jgi:hypothetical protein
MVSKTRNKKLTRWLDFTCDFPSFHHVLVLTDPKEEEEEEEEEEEKKKKKNKKKKKKWLSWPSTLLHI